MRLAESALTSASGRNRRIAFLLGIDTITTEENDDLHATCIRI